MGDLTFQLFSLLLCALIGVTSAVTDEYRIVDTNLGQIRGIRKTSIRKQVEFYSFKGIPYAKPPINDLRFKAPEPAEPWTPKVLDAFEHGNTCPRSNDFLVGDNYPQSEDCLFLNVYVPASAKPGKKLAVMFWIHGGGFTEWSGNDNLFGPDFLVENDVILVTHNYRLGILGFLSFDTPDYSGNMGLKDQQLALKWIHENIKHFGGDNNRITVFGESAGGASTHYHVLSKESRKFFQNAIVLSGSTENVWAQSPYKNHVSLAHQIASDLGESKKSHEDLIAFFKTVPAKTIQKYGAMTLSHQDFRIFYGPIIEREDAKKPFIFESPIDATDIDTNVIFYHTSSEMLTHMTAVFMKFFDIWSVNDDFNFVLPFRNAGLSLNSRENRQLSEKVRSFYFGNSEVGEHSLLQYVNMINDLTFTYPAYKSAKIHAKNGNGKTYFVRFSIDSTMNLLKRLFNVTQYSGAAHCDETCYLFSGSACRSYYDETVQAIDSEHSQINLHAIETITKLFTNFAKYGDPTHKNDLISGFHPILNDDINFLDIANDGLQLGLNPRKHANKFWSHLEETANQMAKEKGIETHEEL